MVMNGNMLQLNLPTSSNNGAVVTQSKKRRVSKYQKAFGRNLKELDAMKRLKNGSYKSGWDRSRILSKAHKMTRKELGMR